ncbi:hypothetical protein P8625_14695 [Tenacibaculum tangerinum]|uniref:Uncharacterized protein n=1 Tax=Tenacibaculum tangerinum TaxID=3038772 RepID=A0ABY8L4L3_9FLAO|nr:hypothetical protein [Tenacibaculum tangerinum]WGH75303.1 hypothetical protein P8625_14695 [Tenacibaculum tangerinum]
MSYKNFVDINIRLDKEEFQANEPISGEIFVKNNSPIHLDIENIQIKLSIKHQGKGETDEITLDYYTVNDHKKISRAETVSSTFTFKPVFNVSFMGKNMTQTVLLTTKVDIKKESEKLLRNENLSDFKIVGYFTGLINPDFHHQTPILITKGNSSYKFKKTSGSIKPGIKRAQRILFFGLIIAGIASVIIYSQVNRLEVFYIFFGIYLILCGVVYVYKIQPSQAIGEIKYKLEAIDNDFYQTSLRLQKRTNIIQHINCQLLGKEKVTYDNGSSRSTTTSTFYKSEKIKVTTINISSFKSKFPEKSLPISIKNNDFEIMWYLKIQVLTKNNKLIEGEDLILIDFEKSL